MKVRSFTALAALLAMFACQKPELEDRSLIETVVDENVPEEALQGNPDDGPDSGTAVFSAVTEWGGGSASGATASRTSFVADGDEYDVVWSSGDQISVNGTVLTLQDSDNPDGYGPGYSKGMFTGKAPSMNGTSPYYKAIYPASLRDRYGNFNLPAEQEYLAGGVKEFPMYAEADKASLAFRNLCGIVCLKLKGDKSISSVSLFDKDPSTPKAMSGRFTVVSDAAVISTGTNGTALICSTPVALNTETFTPFFITVPAQTYGQLQIIVEASDGTICTMTARSAFTVERSMIREIEISSPYFRDETAKISYLTYDTTKYSGYAAGADATVFGDGLTVVSHTYDSGTKTGVITLSGPVTKIGYYAFRSANNIISFTIPNTVTELGDRAFGECGRLTSVNFPRSLVTIGPNAFVNSGHFVPEDLTHVHTIGDAAFQGTGITGTLTIGDNITSLGADAFRNVYGLTEVVWNHTPETLGGGTFYGCSKIESVTINDDLNMPGYMFYNNDKLTSVTFNAAVTGIGEHAFNSCDLLTSIDLPSTVTSIGATAFGSCPLTSITLPDALVSLGESAFTACRSLASVTFPDSGTFTTIGNNCFENCSALSSVSLPSSVTTIGTSAFIYCSSLESIALPTEASFTTIPNYCFKGCTSLESFAVPSNVTTIGANAFQNCTSLESITFPSNASFTNIQSSCFEGCTSLTSADIPASVTNIRDNAFKNCGFTTLPTGWGRLGITYGNYVFRGCPIVSLTFPDEWTSVPNNFCWYWNYLQDVDLGSGITSIGGSAFRECPALRGGSHFVIPSRVTSIGSYCFYGSGITILPDGVNNASITVSDHAFANTALASVDISQWTVIPNSCFGDCSSLTSVVWGSSLGTIQENAFLNCTSLASISDFPASLTLVKAQAFRNTGLTAIPGGMRNDITYGSSLFQSTKIATLTLPDGFTTVPSYMFADCTLLTTLDLNDVTTLETFAFSGCGALNSVDAPAVQTVKSNAFYRNYALTSINLPSAITLQSDAFNECSYLTTVDTGSSLATIGFHCFNQTARFETLIIRNTDAVVSLTTNLNNNGSHPKPAIYVPAGLVDTYKTTSPWTNYADYIHSLDDLP